MLGFKVFGTHNGGLISAIWPDGYSGHGALLLDDGVLRRAFGDLTTTVIVSPSSRWFWAEARSATRILTVLRKCLDVKSARRLDVLVPVMQSFNASVELNASGQLWFRGEMRAHARGDRRRWRRAAGILRAQLTHSLGELRSEDCESAISHVQFHDKKIEIDIKVRLVASKELAVNTDDNGRIMADLDRLFGVHLGRLTGCAAGDLLGDLTPFLHRAKSSLEKITRGTQEAHLFASAVLSEEAKSVWRAIKRPPAENTKTANLDDILATSLKIRRLVASVPTEIRGCVIRMPERHFRILVDTVLDNAAKAVTTTKGKGSSISLRGVVTDTTLQLDILSPFIKPYPKGAGRGIAGIESYLNYWGGKLSDGPTQGMWRVRMHLPLFKPVGQEMGWS